MTNNKESNTENYQRGANTRSRSVSGGVYGLGFIGAVVYYIQHATTFGIGVLGFLKALVWPAVLVYKLMEFLKM